MLSCAYENDKGPITNKRHTAMRAQFKFIRLSALVAILVFVLFFQGFNPTSAHAVTYAQYKGGQVVVVKPGNRSAKQPSINRHSVNRTRQTGGTFEAKYQRVLALLKKDKRLIRKIKSVASKYNIDPMHMVGAIVGEHTYNVDAYDHLQGYYIKAVSYLNTNLNFRYKGVDIDEFVTWKEFERCFNIKDSYYLWSCRESIWNTKISGKTVNGVVFAKTTFGKAFFQPLYAGQTFGLGQINPLTALKMTDLVNRISRMRKLKATDAPEVYRTIMDPDRSLHYMAAIIRYAIDNYRISARFDISKNPGITATLYNLGSTSWRARKLYQANLKRLQRGQGLDLPDVNYYGWLINDKEDELRGLL